MSARSRASSSSSGSHSGPAPESGETGQNRASGGKGPARPKGSSRPKRAARSKASRDTGAGAAAGPGSSSGKSGSGTSAPSRGSAPAAASGASGAPASSAAASSGASASSRGGRRPAAPGGFLAQPLDVVRLAAYAALVVLGAVVGIAGGLVQQGWFPGGLLLALAGSAGAFYGGSRATGTRGGAVAPAAGWLAAVMFLTATRPEGDFVFGAGLGSYVYLLGGMGVAVMCATLGQSPQPGSSDARLGK